MPPPAWHRGLVALLGRQWLSFPKQANTDPSPDRSVSEA